MNTSRTTATLILQADDLLLVYEALGALANTLAPSWGETGDAEALSSLDRIVGLMHSVSEAIDAYGESSFEEVEEIIEEA